MKQTIALWSIVAIWLFTICLVIWVFSACSNQSITSPKCTYEGLDGQKYECGSDTVKAGLGTHLTRNAQGG